MRDERTENSGGRVENRIVSLHINVKPTHRIRTLNEHANRQSATRSQVRNSRRTRRTTSSCPAGRDADQSGGSVGTWDGRDNDQDAARIKGINISERLFIRLLILTKSLKQYELV